MINDENLVDFVPLSYGCNDNCISCPVLRKKNQKNPSFKRIIKEIDLVSKNFNYISFNGGEPTLNEDLIEILNYTQKKNVNEILLLTNANTLSYELMVKKLSFIKNLKIITTLYGGNSLIHDSITRTPGSFNYKIKGINNLIKYKIPIELRILIHKMNYKYFSDIVDFINKNFNSKNFMNVVIMYPKLICNAYKYKKYVAEKLIIISKYLEKPIDLLLRNNFDVRLYHFPHCILSNKLKNLSSGITVDLSEIFFLEKCKNCIFKSKCFGIWKSYYKIFGDDEFKPILK